MAVIGIDVLTVIHLSQKQTKFFGKRNFKPMPKETKGRTKN